MQIDEFAVSEKYKILKSRHDKVLLIIKKSGLGLDIIYRNVKFRIQNAGSNVYC